MYPCAQSVRTKSDTSLCWRWDAGGTVRKRGGRWIDRISPPRPPESLLAHYLSEMNQDRCVYFAQPFRHLFVHVSLVKLWFKKKSHSATSIPFKIKSEIWFFFPLNYCISIKTILHRSKNPYMLIRIITWYCDKRFSQIVEFNWLCYKTQYKFPPHP